MPARWALGVVASVTVAVCAVLGACTEAGPTPATPSSTSSASTFVIAQDFPDPGVLVDGAVTYAYATNTVTTNVQLASSGDLKTWTVSHDDVLPRLPTWATAGRTWAPAVTRTDTGQYVMFFTAHDLTSNLQCIGVATSGSARGPFASPAEAPLVCPRDEGGAIDPNVFVDTDGKAYLVWKNDGNCCGLDTWIYLQQLGAERTTLVGSATRLLKQTLPWEGSLIEAPSLVKENGRYVLFYSANDYSGSRYAIGYATSDALDQAYVKAPQPLLSSTSFGGRYVGPGGQDIVTEPDGSSWMFFHSWDAGNLFRGMDALRLSWSGAVPSVQAP